jgi:fluoroquinolone transport system permease protein
VRTAQLHALARADLYALLRDPLLGWVLLLPLGLALLLRLVIPPAEAALLAAGFDLAPYHPVIMGGYLMTAPGIVGMVVGFLLLDERDSRTLTALRVTPLTMRRYLGYRIVLPLVAGTIATLMGYPIAGMAPLALADLLPLAALAGLAAPILALVLGTAAPNKVAGFAVVKVMNGVNLLPVAAFFLPMPLQLAAGINPTYWPMRALWSAADGEGYGLYLAAGLLINAAALGLVQRLFERRLQRRG